LRKVAGWTFCLWLLNLLLPEQGLATNGLNLIGSGGISSALAGADTAVRDSKNPAGGSLLVGESSWRRFLATASRDGFRRA